MTIADQVQIPEYNVNQAIDELLKEGIWSTRDIAERVAYEVPEDQVRPLLAKELYQLVLRRNSMWVRNLDWADDVQDFEPYEDDGNDDAPLSPVIPTQPPAPPNETINRVPKPDPKKSKAGRVRAAYLEWLNSKVHPRPKCEINVAECTRDDSLDLATWYDTRAIQNAAYADFWREAASEIESHGVQVLGDLPVPVIKRLMAKYPSRRNISA